MNKKISWWKPEMGPKEYSYVKEVLDNNYPNEGSVTKEFEKQVAALVNAKYAISVTSGTTALFLSLKAFGIGHGDEVIVPDITFIATANAVMMAGAKPVFVDIDPTTSNIDINKTTAAITSATKAIIPVHVSGRAADMEALKEIATAHNLALIEDAAEAFMSQHKGKYLGTWADLGCFSFSPHKIITTGQGGIIVTNNEELYKKLVLLKDHGRPVVGTGGDDVHHSVGYNLKFTNLQAAVGLGQLELLQKRVTRAKEIHLLYRKELANNPSIEFLEFDIKCGELPLWTDIVCKERDALQTHLKKHNIECRNYWHPLHTQAPYLQSDEQYPSSIALSHKAMWLPSNFAITNEEIRYVCSTINNFFIEKNALCRQNSSQSYQL